MRLLLTLCLLMLAACGTLPEPESAAASEGSSATEQEVLELVNSVRAEGYTCGEQPMSAAPPLRANAVLTRSAQKHSEDMASAQSMTHTTPEGARHYAVGQSPFERMSQEGYRYRAAGENVAWNYPTPESVVNAWLASPGHCRNIMNPAFEDMGLGLRDLYWTQTLGAQR